MRKQAECEELAAMVAQLSAVNEKLRLENEQLKAENQFLKAQGGSDMTHQDSPHGDEGGDCCEPGASKLQH